MKTRHKRQLDFVDVEKLSIPIHIIGCGGIGSWTALLLSKMGCSNISVYDADIVEDHNIASQFFSEFDLDENKCVATKKNVQNFSGEQLQIKEQEQEEDIEEGIVILAVDSAEERIRLAEIYKDKDLFIIDGRMGGLQAEVYCRHSSDYPEIVPDAENADTDPCTAKAISFNCGFIASMICNYVKQYVNDEIEKNSKDNEFVFLFDNLMMLKKK